MKVVPCIKPAAWKYGSDFKKEMTKIESLIKASRQVDLKKTLIGVLVQIPHADGYAYYRVISDNPFVAEHIPYGDAWEAPAPHLRGLTKRDVMKDELSTRRLHEVFRGGAA